MPAWVKFAIGAVLAALFIPPGEVTAIVGKTITLLVTVAQEVLASVPVH